MTVSAEVILDSIGPGDVRLTTMQLHYPRMIHSEYMTHRAFSRNASSSRAIPVKRLIDMAIEDPAFFESVRYNEPGMQGEIELSEADLTRFYDEWCQLMRINAEYARRWSAPLKDGGYNIHKQHANRVMEPWHHIKVVHTATEIDNFFRLRNHSAADPTMRAVAVAMAVARDASQPKRLSPGEWHLPYIRDNERALYQLRALIKLSTARCARVSYMRHDGTPAPAEEDIALHDRLVVRVGADSDPEHMSPAEHQAQALRAPYSDTFYGNLRGWKQYRKFIEDKEAVA